MMGFYETKVFPHLMDYLLSNGPVNRQRQEVLSKVKGNIVEIGFGTGLNIPNYPSSVKEITSIEVNPGMHTLAEKRIAKSGITVKQELVQNDSWPIADASIDTVVSTWTLCSIADIPAVMSEIIRVLKPGGQFLFSEHGLSHERQVQKWQHRLNPMQNVLGCGCHLNRDIKDIVESQEFDSSELTTFYMPKVPKIMGYMYQGVAYK